MSQRPLISLEPGMAIVFGGDSVVEVDDRLAAAFEEGDRLVVVQDTGDLLHIPGGEWDVAASAVSDAVKAFGAMGAVRADQIESFYDAFADYLDDDDTFQAIARANENDVERARAAGKTTTRLLLSDRMRQDMVDGLRMWARSGAGWGEVVETVEHDGWTLEHVKSGLGVVGFVFEGRPNVFADATGVLSGGNTVVFRIGSAALETARAIMTHSIEPALKDSGLPAGAVSLVDSQSRATGWAMFSDSRLGLAVARGSGAAVAQLGSVARQAGIPVSLHGTGGAWIVASDSANATDFGSAVYHSLDRKVCNTLNTACIVESRAEDLIPVFLDALHRAGERREATSKLHVTPRALPYIPEKWFGVASIVRAEGEVSEPRTEEIGTEHLGFEWEWEESPEVTLTVVPDVATAVELFNSQSPRFIASLISADGDEHQAFFDSIDAPFVGNGFTRWVDGQYALNSPELGLSNWQFGRLFGRGGILSGGSIYTIRSRARQSDPDVGR